MRKGFYNLFIFGLCLMTWLFLRESFSLLDVSVGAGLAVLAWLFNEKILHHNLVDPHRQMHPLVLPRFFLHLFVQIYIAGFVTIGKIISGNIHPGIVEIETDLDNDLYRCFLANSITLTPGTVTVDKEGGKLKVLWLDCVTRDPKIAGDRIKGRFEDILREG